MTHLRSIVRSSSRVPTSGGPVNESGDLLSLWALLRAPGELVVSLGVRGLRSLPVLFGDDGAEEG